MNAMEDCHDLYLEVDVLLSACVFETFKKESIHFFQLDSAYCLTTSGNSWDATQKFTDVNLKLFTDTKNINSLKKQLVVVFL